MKKDANLMAWEVDGNTLPWFVSGNFHIYKILQMLMQPGHEFSPYKQKILKRLIWERWK